MGVDHVVHLQPLLLKERQQLAQGLAGRLEQPGVEVPAAPRFQGVRNRHPTRLLFISVAPPRGLGMRSGAKMAYFGPEVNDSSTVQFLGSWRLFCTLKRQGSNGKRLLSSRGCVGDNYPSWRPSRGGPPGS